MRINFTKIKHTGVSQYLLHEEWIMSLQTMLTMFTGSENTSMRSRRCHWALADVMMPIQPRCAVLSRPHCQPWCSSRHVFVAHCRHSSSQQATGLKSREFRGHNVGGIKSGVSVVNSATVSLARWAGHCLIGTRKILCPKHVECPVIAFASIKRMVFQCN